VSPRKSSTSSGKRRTTTRPRYLGVEVAGELFPPPPARWWEETLRRCLEASPAAGWFRIVRTAGYRAVVEVDQWRAVPARAAWTRELEGSGPAVRLRSRRTWGTLKRAKAWVRAAGP